MTISKLKSGIGIGAVLLLIGAGLILLYQNRPAGTPGDVPLIRAQQKPYKVEPTDPGGMEIPHRNSRLFELLKPPEEGRIERLTPPKRVPVPETDIQTASETRNQTKPAAEVSVPLNKSWRIQLAAFKDYDDAVRAWSLMQTEYAAVLGNLQLHIEKFTAGPGQDFYRVQAKPAHESLNKSDANALCGEVKEKYKGDCVAVAP